MNSLEIKSVRKQLNYDKKLQSYWVELKNSTETLSVPIDEGNADYIEIMRQEKLEIQQEFKKMRQEKLDIGQEKLEIQHSLSYQ